MKLSQNPLFTPWTDPESGITSFVLSRRAAPFQQSFYFTNTSLTADGRYLWFYVVFPPAGDAYQGRQLAVADLEQGEVRTFAETVFTDASPTIDLETGEAYWVSGLTIWKRGPLPEDEPVRVNAFPAEIANNRRPLRIATHLTRSANGRTLNFDAQLGNEWYVGDAPIDGSVPSIWQRFDCCYNHAQFSPTDPDRLLIAQDFWFDAYTGERHPYADRLWTIRRGEQARQVFPDDPSSRRGHEWWDASGDWIWYVDYNNGTERVNIHTGARELVWPEGTWHSHTDSKARYLVGDIKRGLSTPQVRFFNWATGKAVNVVTAFPTLPDAVGHYHVHPHPQFCCGDEYICYTTNVYNRVDVALVPVADLVAATALH